LKKARASLAAKHHTAEKELELLKTVDKLEVDVKQAKKALFEQFCRRRAWGERLDRVNLLDG
jgi:pyruvate-formate lyase-activating enzyme